MQAMSMIKAMVLSISKVSMFAVLGLALFLTAGKLAAQEAPANDAPPPQESGDQNVVQQAPMTTPPRSVPATSPLNVPSTTSVPDLVVIPAGTMVVVRIDEYLSSDRNQVGDRFTGVLQQPIVVNGWVVARRGQVVFGDVQVAEKAGRVKGVSKLGIELTDLTAVDGQQVGIYTEIWKYSAGTSHGQDATTIGTATAVGAVIGAIAGEGKGAAIGAGSGAAAGVATVLLTRGRPTVIEPETQVSFRLTEPFQINTTQSKQAYLPVTQTDFDGGRTERRPHPATASYPPQTCGPYFAPCYELPVVIGVGYYGGGYGWGHGGWRGGPRW